MEEQARDFSWAPKIEAAIMDALKKETPSSLSVMGYSGNPRDCALYCAVSPRHVLWRYERGKFRQMIGVMFLVLPDGKLFPVMDYSQASEIKQKLDIEIVNTTRDSKAIIKMQQEMLTGYQKRLEQMQKRLEALEARSIERDLGAPA